MPDQQTVATPEAPQASDRWIFQIELSRRHADDPILYNRRNWDSRGNRLEDNTAEAQAMWFEERRGKVFYRCVCTHRADMITGKPSMSDKRKVLEGSEVPAGKGTEIASIQKCFDRIGQEIAILISKQI